MQIEETYQQKDDPAVTCTARELHGVKKGFHFKTTEEHPATRSNLINTENC